METSNLNTKIENDRPLIVFDSECMLCTGAMKFILKNEIPDSFNFTALNSEYSKSLNLDRIYKNPIPDSILLYHGNELYVESTAILKMSKWLKRPYSFFSFLIIIPEFLRNAVYRIIAKNRYSWFGKEDGTCLWVPPEQRRRFFD